MSNSSEPAGSTLIRYSNRQLVKDLTVFLRPYRRRFVVVSLLRLSSDIAALYPWYAFASIVTILGSYTAGKSLEEVWPLVGLWILAVAWRTGAKFLAKYFGFQLSERTALDAQLKTIKHLFQLDMAWQEKENSGNRLKRVQKGADGVNRILRMWITNLIEIGVNFVGMILILGKIDTIIGIIMIFFLMTYFSISYLFLKKAAAASQLVDMKEEEVTGLLFQAINNIRSVKVLAMGNRIFSMVTQEIAELYRRICVRIFRFQTRNLVLDTIVHVFRIGTIVIIIYGITQGRYEVGLLVLFNGYFNTILSSVSELADLSQEMIVCKYGIARMQNTLNEPLTIDDEKGKVDLPKLWQTISVKNLSFAYGKHKVLHDVSFDIQRGQRIGIIGLSGAGKSTLMKLFLKENEDFSGEILFDDVSLKKIKKSSYFQRVAAVLQDTEVFNFSLRDNITIASSKRFDKKELHKALEISHVSDYLPKLPQGVETFIGEKGVKLSGGERQRLGIARAVYKRPELLFFDEATSHLDLESEEKIQDSLQTFFQHVTAVVIAHRLTTIRQLDKILVIEKGRVLESGNFQELYAAKGRFFELWEKQRF